jgi:anti-sigma B factor antagonist
MVELDMRSQARGGTPVSTGAEARGQITILGGAGAGVDGDLTIEVRSELDLSTVTALRSVLETALRAASGRVVIDLSAVEFMDCASLRPLRAAARSLRRRGRDLVLRHPSPAVRRLLEVTGVGSELPLDPGPPGGCAV